jgi:hypothetical protein
MPVAVLDRPAQKPAMGSLKLDITNSLTAGLVAALPFTEYGSGVPREQGGLISTQPSLYSNVAIGWTSTTMGPALNFTGSQALLLGTANNARTTTNLTICAWISHPGAAAARAIVAWANTGPSGPYEFRLTTTNTLELLRENVASLGTSTTAVATGRMVPVAVTYNGAATRFFIDGNFVNAPAASGSFSYASSDQLAIGMMQNGSDHFTGTVAAVYIWNRLLSDNEIAVIATYPYSIWSVRPLQWPPIAAPIAAQKARPIADVADGSWLNEAASNVNLYASVDEPNTASDSDYIESAASPVNDLVKVRLGALVDPAVGNGHVVRYRYLKDVTAGEQINLIVRLYQADGTTVVASASHTNIDAVQDGEFTLTSTEANTIPSADYSTGLVLGFEADVP